MDKLKPAPDDQDTTQDQKETTVFKVPVLAKKATIKKERPVSKLPADGNPANDKESTSPEICDSTNGKEESAEKRPLVSFQPKSLTLPSQVYKPHRPSASEYIKHYYKMEKEGKQPRLPLPDTSTGVVDSEKSEIKAEEAAKPKSTGKSKLNYIKPEWSCQCADEETSAYSLEVLKGGSIIDKMNLFKKEFFVFGRLSDCDVTLEHPSISRHHAVLQFGKPTENDNVEFQKDGSAGFYLYDLNSTHGTYLNKAPVPSKKYYRVKVGHMMKFGGSSRTYILQGPEDDEEEEAKETPTELIEKARAARKKKDLAKMMMGDDSDDEDDLEEDTNERAPRSECDTGITWGMLEEAVVESDEDEEEKEEEPTFSLQDKKEPFYMKDPNKALKNFYSKEGIEVDFECIERRPGQWNVRLELPIDTPSGKAVVAEASVTGKRKDAMNNCAVEACRLLDKYGMFKQSEHHRRKVKEWEKEDFYDSDEDQYWDRTGDLDTKRRQRKQRIGVKSKATQDGPETYESLKKQIDELEKEILEIEEQLEKDKKATQTKEGSTDPLEEFMRNVKSGKTLDSITRSKLKQRLFAIRKESARLVKLADVARPVSLPPLSSQSSKSMSFIGKMKGKRKVLSAPSKLPPAPVYKPLSDDADVVEEEEEEDNEVEKKQSSNGKDQDETTKDEVMRIGEDAPNSIQVPSSSSSVPGEPHNGASTVIPVQSTKDTTSSEPSSSDASSEASIVKRKRMFGPTLPQELKERLMEDGGASGDPSTMKKKKQRKTCSSDPNYADWLPPEDQSGDGTTSLNARYGY